MIAYVDSSVLLRFVFGETGLLAEWSAIRTPLASRLVEVECLRTIDRARVRHALSDKQIAALRQTAHRLIAGLDLVEVTRAVLVRASHPFSTALGTLDALHLATALLWREQSGADPVLATHDAALALAARSHGLRVVGA